MATPRVIKKYPNRRLYDTEISSYITIEDVRQLIIDGEEFMASYLEKSMQLFLDQQQQFRTQMGGLLGQTPWTLMNQLTERNLQMWKDFQHNLSGNMGTPTGRKSETQK
jgi:polyhydroxyalkanoate synthesis regulator protein